jgi:UDP-N-acetylglucosamine 2-epimerase
MLGFPAVLLRTSTERPEAIDCGGIVIGGIKTGDIIQAVKLARGLLESGEPVLLPHDYGDGNVSVKVVRIIQSYAKLIDKFVWDKDEG